MSNATTITTSNGPLVLDSTITMRSIPVTLGELSELDWPEGVYTHVLSYDGVDGTDGIVGSTLLRPEDAERVRMALSVAGVAA